jgi:hypothetical protein
MAMSLTSEEIVKIQIDLMNGSKPRVTGPEADALREAMKPEIAEAERQGLILDLPDD